MGNVIVCSILAVVIILALAKIVKDKKSGRSSCGCDCASCGNPMCKGNSKDKSVND